MSAPTTAMTTPTTRSGRPASRRDLLIALAGQGYVFLAAGSLLQWAAVSAALPVLPQSRVAMLATALRWGVPLAMFAWLGARTQAHWWRGALAGALAILAAFIATPMLVAFVQLSAAALTPEQRRFAEQSMLWPAIAFRLRVSALLVLGGAVLSALAARGRPARSAPGANAAWRIAGGVTLALPVLALALVLLGPALARPYRSSAPLPAPVTRAIEPERATDLRGAMRQLMQAQEMHFALHLTYALRPDELEFLPAGTRVNIGHATAAGWAGSVTDRARPERSCAAAYGDVPLPVMLRVVGNGAGPGRVVCTPAAD